MEVAYAVRPSKVAGQGLFVTEAVKAGTCVWRYMINENVLEFDAQASRAHLANMATLAAQQDFLNSTFGRGQKLCLILDEGRFMNHAAAPLNNCRTDLRTGNCFAVRDLAVDEELLEDYASFAHPDFLYDLLSQYECAPAYYELPLAKVPVTKVPVVEAPILKYIVNIKDN